MRGMEPELPGVSIERLDGKKLRCRIGRHVIITDRKPADGGADAGCTSGELLLAAVGSCAAGSTRRYLDEHGMPAGGLTLNVRFEYPGSPDARDRIAIDILVPGPIDQHQIRQIADAALSGGVVSRLAQGSEITVLCRQADGGNKMGISNDVG